jgi:L-glutamine---4-(methylsulfanyl)-2-oxobutanoate aminotransferase
MMFKMADRMQQLPPQFFFELVKKVNREIQAGHDVINLGQGSPDLPTPRHIVAAMQAAVAKPQHHRYAPFRGHRYLKEAIAKRYLDDYGVELDIDREIAVLFGGKSGLVELSQVLLNPRDVCLMPDPGYPDYWSGVAMSGAQMYTMPLTLENQFFPDFNAIPADQLALAKLMFLNYPNNPTSAMVTAEQFATAIEFAKTHRIAICSDFAYGTIGFDGRRPISFLELPGAKEVGVEVYTMSKSYNMAGWRIGFMLGNAQIIEMIETIQDHYYCSIFGAIQEAAAVALTEDQSCVKELTARYEHRRNVLYAAMAEIGWVAPPCQGSFFAWLPVPSGMTSVEFVDLVLSEAKVMFAPGVGFGKQGEGYVRCALLAEPERIREAMARIEKLGLFRK